MDHRTLRPSLLPGLPDLTRAAASAGMLLSWLGAGALPLLAATPSPATGGDPRSPGEGPGLVGDPVLAIAIVAAIAVGSVALTLLYLRLTERR
jgi:hypothetical protein